jgi:hypothetical protein
MLETLKPFLPAIAGLLAFFGVRRPNAWIPSSGASMRPRCAAGRR